MAVDHEQQPLQFD
jgi:hypothetical protein